MVAGASRIGLFSGSVRTVYLVFAVRVAPLSCARMAIRVVRSSNRSISSILSEGVMLQVIGWICVAVGVIAFARDDLLWAAIAILIGCILLGLGKSLRRRRDDGDGYAEASIAFDGGGRSRGRDDDGDNDGDSGGDGGGD
jgi:hypothetical protein